MAGSRLHRASKFPRHNTVRWSNIYCRPKRQHDGEHKLRLDGECDNDRLVNYPILKGEEPPPKDEGEAGSAGYRIGIKTRSIPHI